MALICEFLQYWWLREQHQVAQLTRRLSSPTFYLTDQISENHANFINNYENNHENNNDEMIEESQETDQLSIDVNNP